MWNSLPVLALLAATGWTAPSEKGSLLSDLTSRVTNLTSGLTSGPSVDIEYGTVVGSTYLGTDTFKGIPFAQPPIGDLRLRVPQPITENFGTFDATGSPKACPQFTTQLNTSNLPNDVLGMLADSPLFQEIADVGEDCLTINVVRPTTATNASALPVLFWIYGGGFTSGSAPIYPGSSLVLQSIKLAEPIIFVSVNYRLGGFGFLAGDELADEGSTNLGLRDQRLGMQWVQDNIAAFGGDPSRVTIWGESAGAVSVCDHTLINGGDNTYNGKALFQGAIMDSGSLFPVDSVRTEKAKVIYQTVVSNAGCSSSNDTLACLRAADYTTFLNAANSVPSYFGYRSVDLAYLPRPDPNDTFFSESPEVSVANGAYTRVPVIIGDQEDEGTAIALAQSNITTAELLIDYLVSYFPTNPTAEADVTALMATYPDEPLLGQPEGSPFNDGILYNIYPEFKRLAAVLGDLTFTLTRRIYLDTISQEVDTWSYLSSYFHLVPVLGTFHASDLIFAFGILPGPITDTIQTSYISFVNHLNPNTIALSGTRIEWPQWNSSSPELMQLLGLSNTLIKDDFRSNSYEYLKANLAKFRR